MGFNVFLETELPGVTELRDPHGYVDQFLPRANDTTSPCLRSIVANDEATFDSRQIPLVRDEFRARRSSVHSPEALAHLDELLQLLETAAAHGSGAYVTFTPVTDVLVYWFSVNETAGWLGNGDAVIIGARPRPLRHGRQRA